MCIVCLFDNMYKVHLLVLQELYIWLSLSFYPYFFQSPVFCNRFYKPAELLLVKQDCFIMYMKAIVQLKINVLNVLLCELFIPYCLLYNGPTGTAVTLLPGVPAPCVCIE